MDRDHFPIDVDDFGLATARLLALSGMREEVKLLVAQDRLQPFCVDYDNWNGGQWTWQFDLALPLLAYQSLAQADRETMSERITSAMREVINAHDSHSMAPVRIVMAIPKAHPTWRVDAKAWAEGKGISNQGRVRSTNIAPFEEDGLLFRSKPEICLYRALKGLGVTLAPLPVFIRGGQEYMRLEPDFVLVHRGAMMIVEVDGEAFHLEAPVDAHERLAVLSREGVHTERVRAADCATDALAGACAIELVAILDRIASNR